MRARVAVAVSVLLLLVAGAHLSWLDAGPCGQDAWILVEASRVEQAGDVVGLFGQELRDFVRPSTGFYRPLVNLSFAVDDLLARGSWRALHASSILLHGLAALALLALLRRLGVGLVLATAGAALFAVHPISVEVVPAPARRGESLVLLLLLLSGWALLAAHRNRRWLWMAGAAGALAPLAKEPGFVLPLLWWALPARVPVRRRVLLAVACVLPALLLRSLVLAGEGGYGGGWDFTSRGWVDAQLDLADPFRLTTGWGARLLVAAVAALGLHAWGRGDATRRALARVGFAIWLAPMAVVTLARGIAPWYLYLPLAGWCILLVAMVQPWREPVPSPRMRMGSALLAIVVLSSSLLPSPLWVDYREWHVSGEASRRAIGALEQMPEMLEASRLDVVGLPREVHLRPRPRFPVRSATGLSADSLRRCLELRRGRGVLVQSRADLSLNGPAPWRVSCNPDEEGNVLIRCESNAHLLPPMWPAPGAVDFAPGAREVRMPLPPGGLWWWDGRRWNRLEAAATEEPTDGP